MSFTPEILHVLAIWLLAVVSPGPAFLMLSQLAAGRSRAAALAASVGIAMGAILYAALTLWGLAIVVHGIAWVGTALRVAGAIYLVYLGLSMFATSAEATATAPRASSSDAVAGLRTGFLTAITNPKAIAFFLSLFAVALPRDLRAADKLTLLSGGFAIELCWYVLVALVFSGAWLRGRYERCRKVLDRVLGSALVLLGIRLGVQR